MMRSLYSGVSGLQNHQTRMDVIGNNISNVNTTGFKRGRVNFQDMISQQVAGAAKPTEELGGVNPKDVGLGMTISTIEQVFTQGNLQSTGVGTDVAIQGNGFFIVKNGDESFYTRNGVFGLDRDGTLVNPANGMRVQGWMARDLNGEQIVQTAATPTDLVIPVGSKDPAKATENVLFACNLNKNTPEILEGASASDVAKGTWNTEQKIYDSFGNEHLLSINFTKVPGVANSWQATVNVDADNADFTQTRIGLGTTDGVQNTFIVNFDNYGQLSSVTDSAGNISNETGEIVLQSSFTVADANADENGTPARQSFNINLGTIGSMKNTITQSASKSTTKAYSQDGYTLGYLDNYKIDSSGTITGVYSNGTNRVIGQIALATFSNDRGLEKAGDNTYVETNNSGQANIGESGVAGKGSLLAGALEMSNVDLSEQMTDMIVTQRGFQANSKTIQTADTLLETVLGLKR
ncbi:MAG: flagellar hook protein FlgE [Spirochaetia bacterium]|nr:flagellar hook protein FlgE [Treponema sp.]MCI6366746.1 flagellar hook protein FlgE [Spirochaetia bacterium]MCI6546439.1 flagellar hook protein FlgE [Spirochaetia bacterium]MCI7436554.1 flagellar hook protein FlgE [Spirochaetia bacterium]MDY2826089.1 flagellar hook protein FlgE [Treponema sp.]